jgi:major membrane immunogen (membrane-anchored lipoprotein)
MKNIAKGFAMLMVLAIALSSCGGGNGAGFEDGVYFAMEDGYSDSGWRYNVTMVVEDGEVSEVSWNGSNINGGVDKVTLSENGGYPMVERGGAMAEWHVQAKTVEDFFLAEQSTEQPMPSAAQASTSMSSMHWSTKPLKPAPLVTVPTATAITPPATQISTMAGNTLWTSP